VREIGTVVQADQDNCRIEFVRSSACEKCGACTKFGEKSMCVTLPNAINAQAGDTVEVEMSSKNVIGASLWAYIFPLCMLVAGAIIGKWISSMLSINGDWIVAVAALVFAGISFLILRLMNPYFANRQGFKPVMVEILNSKNDTN
jgi:sigma-E factor negative regulatory protein RseC